MIGLSIIAYTCTLNGLIIILSDTTIIPYITLGVTEGVVTQSVPVEDDDISAPIHIPSPFPFGSHHESTVYVRKHVNLLEK